MSSRERPVNRAADLRPLSCGSVVRSGGLRHGAGIVNVDITVVVVITQTPDDWTLSAVVYPAPLPVFPTAFDPSPRYARPERVVDATKIHFYTQNLSLIHI